MAKPLNDRIAAAMANSRARLTDIEDLIGEARAEIESLSAAAAKAVSDSLDFTLCEEDREAAAARAERHGRSAKALNAAVDRLSEILDERRNREAAKAAEEHKAAILAERDRLAEALRTEWPAIERRMVELLTQIEANDAARVGARMSDASAEAVARGLPGNFFQHGQLKRLTGIKLPSFSDGMRSAWPVANIHQVIAASYGEIRREGVDREDRAQAAERASWRPYRIQPTNRVPFWTQLSAKASPDQVRPDLIDIYNETGTEPPPRELYLKAEVAEAIERSGFMVEPLDKIERAA
jgi:hypothetical protein